MSRLGTRLRKLESASGKVNVRNFILNGWRHIGGPLCYLRVQNGTRPHMH